MNLTEYSIAGGCGCKIPAEILDNILNFTTPPIENNHIILGFKEKDDAIIYSSSDKSVFIQSLDFFSPIIDDAYAFGKIAAANALSDIFAKGGTPFIALSILGYPNDLIPFEIPKMILQGAIDICNQHSVSIAGGHSIRNPQVIFGLSVTGQIDKHNIKPKSGAKDDDWIYMTKPLGIGIYSTAIKKKIFQLSDFEEYYDIIVQVNQLGKKLGHLEYVNSMTDITGFGLIGHLSEICAQSDKSAEIYFDNILTLKNVKYYMELDAISQGGKNNASHYFSSESNIDEYSSNILSDPQTNGGLMVTISSNYKNEFSNFLIENGLEKMINPIGQIIKKEKNGINIRVLREMSYH